jgi:hypothetical protein
MKAIYLGLINQNYWRFNMTYAAVAIGGAALVGGGMVTQGYFANKSSKKSARAQRDAMAAYLAEMRRSKEAAIGYQRPYEEAGRSGLNLLQQYLTGDPSTVQNRLEQSPGYQFRLDQGQESIQNLLASKGGLKSGAAMKAIEQYAQGTASQEFGNQIGYLQGLAGIGQNASLAMSNAEMNAGSNMASASQQGISGAGMAMANRDAQMGNILGSGMGQIGSSLFGLGMQGMGSTPKSPSGFTSTGGGQYNSRAFMNSGQSSMGF